MSIEGAQRLAARQFPDHYHSVPSRCLHVIEFFSDLVSNAIAIIGQVKEIARHGLDQCRCRTHVPKSASQDSAPTRRLRRDGPGLGHHA
jgi:hypothetical protein